MTAEQLLKLCSRGDIFVVFDSADGIKQVSEILDPMYPTVRWVSNNICSHYIDVQKEWFKRCPVNSIICFAFTKSRYGNNVCISYYPQILGNVAFGGETIEQYIRRHKRYLYYKDFLDLLKQNRYIINKEVI